MVVVVEMVVMVGDDTRYLLRELARLRLGCCCCLPGCEIRRTHRIQHPSSHILSYRRVIHLIASATVSCAGPSHGLQAPAEGMASVDPRLQMSAQE